MKGGGIHLLLYSARTFTVVKENPYEQILPNMQQRPWENAWFDEEHKGISHTGSKKILQHSGLYIVSFAAETYTRDIRFDFYVL